MPRPAWPPLTDTINRAALAARSESLRAVRGAMGGRLTARIVMRDVAYYSPAPTRGGAPRNEVRRLRGAAGARGAGDGSFPRLALGLAAERRWGLRFALVCLLEVVVSNLIFMMTYMDDIGQGRNVRLAGLIGIVAVLLPAISMDSRARSDAG